MPDLEVEDISLHRETDGRGPPLLLLADMLSDRASWCPPMPATGKHRVPRLHICAGSSPA
jgi:hypothetical protein